MKKSEEFYINSNELNEILKKGKLNTIQYLKDQYNGINGLCLILNVNPKQGLSCFEKNDLKKRAKHFGTNQLMMKKNKTFLRFICEAFSDATLIILLVCAFISIALAIYSFLTNKTSFDFSESGFLEGITLLIMIVVIVTISTLNNYQKEQQFRELQNKIKREVKTNVVRDGVVKEIPTYQLLVGDICIVKYGDVIPADGILIQCEELRVDESSLTGESDLIKKELDSDIALMSGTHIMQGTGQMLVTGVGLNSQTGMIVKLMTDQDEIGDVTESKSVLKKKLESLARWIGIFGTIISLLTFLILSIEFSIKTYVKQKKSFSSEHLKVFLEYFMTGVTILVLAIPEGLPLAITIVLAYSVNRMAKENNLVRNLDACETMGNATTICLDKTGTLTTNQMTVEQCYIGGYVFKELAHEKFLSTRFSRIPMDLMRVYLSESILYNTAPTSRVEMDQNNQVRQYGIKTECALLSFLYQAHPEGRKCDVARQDFSQSGRLEAVFPFNSSRKLMRTIIKLPNNHGYRVLAKGAPEVILERCKYIHGINGILFELGEQSFIDIKSNIIDSMGRQGLRTICLAYMDLVRQSKHTLYCQDDDTDRVCKVIEDDMNVDWDDDCSFNDMTCLAIFGIQDPVRPGVSESIEECQNAGITVRMVTGDSRETACAIALKCGIIDQSDIEEPNVILESNKFNELIRDKNNQIQQDKFDNIFPNLRVLSRSTPEDKCVLVKHIIESKINTEREIVAVTGDGTNDAPALKMADVGFAMGISGTEVAKEASDIIITNDNFNSLVRAIVWGRYVNDSICKFIQFQVSVNVVAVTVSVVSAISLGTTPLKATQMLWLNLLMDTLGSLAISTENPSARTLLLRRPKGRTRPLISSAMLFYIIANSIYQLIIIFILIFLCNDWFDVVVDASKPDILEASQHFTMVFNTLVLFTLFNLINARKSNGDRNCFRGFFDNWIFVAVFVSCFLSQILIVQYFNAFFQCYPLNMTQWFYSIAIGSSILIWQQIICWFRLPIIQCFRYFYLF